eukprot:Hpha_TRINITY_DN16076_c1_g1::TRINITY_DN16076_c1_g1_i10::g.119164::m.119164
MSGARRKANPSFIFSSLLGGGGRQLCPAATSLWTINHTPSLLSPHVRNKGRGGCYCRNIGLFFPHQIPYLIFLSLLASALLPPPETLKKTLRSLSLLLCVEVLRGSTEPQGRGWGGRVLCSMDSSVLAGSTTRPTIKAPCDLAVLRVRILLAQRLESVGRCAYHPFPQHVTAPSKRALVHTRRPVELSGVRLFRRLQDKAGQPHTRCGLQTGRVAQRTVVELAVLSQVHRTVQQRRVRVVARVDQLPREGVRRRQGESEVKLLQHVRLHRQHLVPRVGVRRDVHIVTHLRREHLLELCRDHHACTPQQLQLAFHHLPPRQVPVDQAHSQEKRLRPALVLQVNVHQPVDQDHAHLLRHLLLHTIHVVSCHHRVTLHLPQVPRHAREVASRALNILAPHRGRSTARR